MKDLEDVASVLIREGLHVTALELNSELHRTKGRELKTIRDYFSNSSTRVPASASAKAKSPSSLYALSGSHSNSIGRKSNSPSLNESEYITAAATPRLSSLSPTKVAQAAASIGSGNNTSYSNSASLLTKHKRSPSIQTFDSLDFARGSDDGIEKSMDRIAVLEFELRKAKETIKSLRTSLTIATIESAADSCIRPHLSSSSITDSGPSDPLFRQQQLRHVKLNENEETGEESNQANAVPAVLNDSASTTAQQDQGPSLPSDSTGVTDASQATGTSDLLIQVKDIDAACKPHEKRAVNFLVHEFLMKNNIRMTAITLSEEINDQDFENWEDVGLNIQKPPQLLQLYRFFVWSLTHFKKHGGSGSNRKRSLQRTSSSSAKQDAETQTTSDAASLTSGDGENGKAAGGRSIDRRSSQQLRDEEDVDEGTLLHQHPIRLDQETQTDKLLAFFKRTSGDDEDELGEEKRKEENGFEKLEVTPFQRVLLEESGILSCDEIYFDMIKDDRTLIQLLAYDFPQIVANYKPDQRSDLIPILVSTIYACPDHQFRASLLNCFFNLIEKPNHCERRMILSAFVSLAKELSVKDVEEDLLPLVWEQINHKSAERRILVAESCADLLPLVSNGIRVSLIYSILSQILIEEKDLHVKESAVKVLSFLITIFTTEKNDDKFDPVLRQILIPIIHDLERITSFSMNQEEVIMKSVSSFRKVVVKFFIPCVCYWSFRLEKMFTVTNELLNNMKQTLEDRKSNQPLQENAAVIFMNSLEIAIPFLFVSLIQSMPAATSPSSETATAGNQATAAASLSSAKNESHRYCFISNKLLNMNLISNDPEPIKELIIRFDQYISRDWFKPWPVWEEMFERSFLPVIVNQIIPSIGLNQKNLLTACISFCSSFGQHFGLSVIRSKAKPIFLKNIYMKMNDLSNALLPAFASLLISIKPIQDEEKRDLTNCLAKCLIHLSLESCLTVTSSSSSAPTAAAVASAGLSSGSSSLHASSQYVKSIEITINYLVNESHSELTRSDINRCILQFLQETGSNEHVDVKKNSGRIINSFIESNFSVSLGNNGFSELIHDLLHKGCILDALSIDPEIEVRSLTIPAYGSLYILIHEQLNRIKGFDESDVKRILDQINIKLHFFLEDPINRDQHMIHLELISIFARIARSCSVMNHESVTITAKSFLDFSLPRIAALTVQTRSNVSLSRSKKQEIVLALIDSYTKFSFIPIGVNEQLIRESIMPSLKLMREEVLDVAPEYEETIIALMAEFDKKLPQHDVSATSGIESLISKSMSLHRLKRESTGSTTPIASPSSHYMAHSQPSTPTTGTATGPGMASATPVMDELKTRFKGLFKKQ